MSDSPKKGKSDPITAEQIVYEYVADIPFTEAIEKLEHSPETQEKWRLDLFETDTDFRNYAIVIKHRRMVHSHGYQLRLRPWAQGEQSHVSIHRVDYHSLPSEMSLFRRFLGTISPLLLILVLVTFWRFGPIEANFPLLFTLMSIGIIGLFVAFLFNKPTVKLSHSTPIEVIILHIVQEELGASEPNPTLESFYENAKNSMLK